MPIRASRCSARPWREIRPRRRSRTRRAPGPVRSRSTGARRRGTGRSADCGRRTRQARTTAAPGRVVKHLPAGGGQQRLHLGFGRSDVACSVWYLARSRPSRSARRSASGGGCRQPRHRCAQYSASASRSRPVLELAVTAPSGPASERGRAGQHCLTRRLIQGQATAARSFVQDSGAPAWLSTSARDPRRSQLLAPPRPLATFVTTRRKTRRSCRDRLASRYVSVIVSEASTV